MFDGILFDCDGVLFESTAANLAFYNAILREFEAPEVLPHEEDRVRLCHTAASKVVLETLLGPEKGAAALVFAGSMGYQNFIPDMQPEGGMPQALQNLSADFKLGVATNRGGSIGPILDHFKLKQYFSTVVCCLDVAAPKPAPDMLLLGARQLDLPVDKILFVGDSALDRQAAQTAGMPFAAYRTIESGDYKLESYSELLQLVSSSG